MFNDIRLYISNEQVEFNTIPDILYNWTETDFSNPIVTKNSYSKTIRIPGTKQNNKIFGHYFQLDRYQLYSDGNTGTNFNPTYKVPFSLYVNSNLFEKGYVKLQKVTLNNGIYTYEISLFGGLGSFLYNLSVNEEDGSIKTFNSLNFYDEDELIDFGFTINKETVKQAWDEIYDYRSKFSKLNFAPVYNGIPEKFSSNKVLINFSGISESILPQSYAEDGYNYGPQNGSYSIGELPENLDSWQVKDLRSYMQVPVFRVKTIFDALQRRENSKGMFDDGYEVILDNGFFNSDNPYYYDAFISLPKITTLTFTDDTTGERQEYTAYTVNVTNDYSEYSVTENTTITFELPQTVNQGNLKAHIIWNLYNTVTKPSTVNSYPQILYLQPSFVGPELLWYSENRTALGAQLLATSENNTVITGSSIDWFTSMNYDSKYFSCNDAINIGSYSPKFPTSVINKKTGAFNYVSSTPTSALYLFNKTIDLEISIPSGTKKIQLNLQRCSEKSESEQQLRGTRLFQYGNRDLPNLTFNGVYNVNSSGFTEVLQGGSGDGNFFSQRYVKQSELLTTDYSISEWLISYCKMFGLYIHKDPIEDKIYIDTRNTYYQKYQISDISGIIDYSKEFSVNPVYITNKFYTLTNPMEKTKYSETYLSNNGNEYGMKLINTGFEFEATRKELLDSFKIKTGIPVNRQDIYNFKPLDGINPYVYNGFKYKLYMNSDFDYEKTHDIEIPKKQISKAYRNLFFDNDFPYYDSFYKMCFENDGKEVNSSNVFLFFNGFADVSGDGYYLTDDLPIMSKLNNNPCWISTKSETASDGTSVGISLREIPKFSSYYTSGEDIKYSSNFGSPRELFIKTGELISHEQGTLYSQFYEKYYADLFDVNTKVVTCYIKPENVLTSESLRKLYWFENAIWRLNKVIDYSPIDNQTVKCEFIKIQDLNALEVENPSSRLILVVTLDKYEVSMNGETINGNVFTSDYGQWEYEGSNVDQVVVTPNRFQTGCDISVEIPATNIPRVIRLYFTAGDISTTVTLTQGSEEDKYFVWDATQLSGYAPTVSASTTSFTASYTSNYDNLVFTPQTSGISVTIDSNTQITLSFPENTTTSIKEYRVNVYSGNINVGYISITQEQVVEKYLWIQATGTTAVTETVNADTPSKSYAILTNYNNEEFLALTTSASSWISVSEFTPSSITLSLTPNTSTEPRTGVVYIKSGNTVKLEISLTQAGVVIQPYFYWVDTGLNSITAQTDSASTVASRVYSTNYENIQFDFGDFITGVSVFNSVVDVNFEPNFIGGPARTSTVSVKSDGVEIGTFTINQNAGESYYFYWNENNNTGITAQTDSASTIIEKAFSTNYENLNFNYGGWISLVELTGTTVKVYVDENIVGNTARTTTIAVLSNNTQIGTLTVNQYAGEEIYFYWVENNNSAITVSNIAWNTSYISKECRTNIPQISFGLDSVITGASINAGNTYITASFGENPGNIRYGILQVKYGNDVYGLLDISQNMRDYFFEWDVSEDDSYFETVSASTTSFTASYTSDFPNITFSAETGITAVERVGETAVTIRFEVNNNLESKELRLYPISQGRAIGLLKITQLGVEPYFYWVENSESAITADVSSASTQVSKEYRSNIRNLSLQISGMITGYSHNNNIITAAYSENPITSGRSGEIEIYSGNDLVGIFEVNQAEMRYFYWNSTNTSGISVNVAFDVDFATEGCTTNIIDFQFSGTGMVTGGSVNASNEFITGLFSINPLFATRNGMLMILDGNEEVGWMDITQGAKTHTFKFDENNSDTLRVTVNSATTSYTATYTTDYDNINYTTENCTYEPYGANGVRAKFTANTTGVERWIRLYVNSNQTTVGLLWIIQNP